MSNPAFDFLDEEQGGDGGSNPMKDLRNHAKALEKQVKALEKENGELVKFREEVETAKKHEALGETFNDLGLTAKQAELFFKTRDDETEINPEDIKLWALDYGLISNEEEEQGEPDPLSTPRFTPIPKTAGGPPSSRVLTSDEWNELLQSNPEEAMAVAQEGRVQFADSL